MINFRFVVILLSAIAVVVVVMKVALRDEPTPRQTPPAREREQELTAGRYARFVQENEPRMAEDPRLQFYVGEMAMRCETSRELFERIGTPIDADCVGFETDQPWQYWRDAALAARDPLATLTSAVEKRLTHDAPEEELNEALTEAALSQDPEVQMAMGFAMLNPAIHPDPVDGLAWLLVSCGDCLTDDPRVGLGCAAVGACAYGMTLSQWMRDAFPEHVDEAESRAASLRELYKTQPKRRN